MDRKGRQKAGNWTCLEKMRGIILSLLMMSGDMMLGFKMFLFLCVVSFVHQHKKEGWSLFL